MSDRIPPHNLQAEESLLGALLLSNDAVEKAIPLTCGADFYVPSHRFIYEAIHELYGSGETIDPVTVADVLRRDQLLEFCGGQVALVRLQTTTPATSSAARYARIVAEHASMRAIIRICTEGVDLAYECPADVSELVESLQAEIDAIVMPGSKLPERLWLVENYMNRPKEDRPDWVIRGILRKGWRVVIVAVEGFGKTMLLHQLALTASRGIHPFVTNVEIPKVTTLMIDCENPDDRLDEGFELITPRMEKVRNSEHGQAWLWSEPGGINVRSRRDRAGLEAVIAHVKPQIVCAGPVYKLFLSKTGETYEQSAREFMAVWDNLRTRYGFALVLEAHATKGAGGLRSYDPEGSALWLRWSEFRLKMLRDDRLNGPDENVHYKVARFSGDRITKHAWPDGLSRDEVGLPWGARWNNSYWQEYIYDTGELIEYPRPQPAYVDDNEPQDDGPF